MTDLHTLPVSSSSYNRVVRLAAHLMAGAQAAALFLIDAGEERCVALTGMAEEYIADGCRLPSRVTAYAGGVGASGDSSTSGDGSTLREGHVEVPLVKPLDQDDTMALGRLVVYGRGAETLTDAEWAALHDLAALAAEVAGRVGVATQQSALERAVEQSADVIFITDPNGVIQYANPAVEGVLGYAPEEAIGQTPRLFKSGLVPQETYEVMWGTLLAGAPFRGTLINRHRDDRIVHLEQTITPLKDDRGAITHFVSTGRDITRRVETERRLRESEQRLSLFFNQSLDGFFFMLLDEPVAWPGPGDPKALDVEAEDPEALLDYVFTHQRVTQVNGAFASHYGATPEEMLGATPADFFPDDPDQGRSLFRRLFDEGRLFTLTQEPRLDGQGSVWVEGEYKCLYDDEGRVVGHFGVQRDVTQRVGAEERLREREALLSSINRHLTEGIFRCTLDGQLLYVNRAFAKLFGYSSAEDVQAVLLGDLCASVDRKPTLSGELAERGRFMNEDIQWRRRDGSTFWGLVSAVVVEGEDGEPAYIDGALADITARREAEEAVRKSEERWRRLVENNPEAIQICVDGRLVYVNPAGCAVYGARSPEQLLGQDTASLFPEEVHEHLLRRQDALTRGESVPPVETYLDGLDGWRRYVEIFSVPVDYKGQPAIQTVLRDVTAQHSYERGLEEARLAAEEMSRLKSAFLTNMSHEIRTPLTTLMGCADLLAEELPEAMQEFADMMTYSSRRILETVSTVLDLAQVESDAVRLQGETFVVARRAREVAAPFVREAEAKGLTFTVREELPPGFEVHLDPGAFDRILGHLLSNAVKFTEEGEVVVTLRAETEHLEVTVRDTGIGIEADFLPRAFDAFQQESCGEDRAYEGNGIGLAVAKQLVELAGGTVDVTSRKGAGSTFTVRWPLVSSPSSCSGALAGTAIEARPRLLMVEDSLPLRYLAQHLLHNGVAVHTVVDLENARRLVQDTRYQALVVDAEYQNASPADIVRDLRAGVNADVPVVLLTRSAEAVDLPGVHRVRKPCSWTDLSDQIRGLLT